MQGVVFTLFSELVIEKFGIETWNDLIDTSSPQSEGVYTSGQQYPSEELKELVVVLSAKTSIPQTDLVRAFGHFLFDHLINMSPVSIEQCQGLGDLLMIIDETIHGEVKRLNPTVTLPSIKVISHNSQEYVMEYKSIRKLCFLAEGLIQGAADYYGTPIMLKQTDCMHDGCDHCKIIITFTGSP